MPIEPGPSRSADPVALVHGHRLQRAARLLEAPAWLFGLGSWLMLGLFTLLEFEYEQAAVGLGLTILLGWVLWRDRSPLLQRAAGEPGQGMPEEIQLLLLKLDDLVEALERGEDAAFEVGAAELGVTIERLGAQPLRYLDERGADRARLRDIGRAEQGTFSADRRRALHLELLRFAATVRGRPQGDPYRSSMGGGSTLLAGFGDRELGRTWRWYFAAVVSIELVWMAVSIAFALPGGGGLDRAYPSFFVESELARAWLFALAMLPMSLLAVARVTRAVAWRCWSAALPEHGELDALASQGLGRRLLWRDRMLRSVLSAIMVVAVAERLPHYAELILLLGLVTLALVVIPALVAKLIRQRNLREARGGIERVFAYRCELAEAEPVRADVLEQLADTLATIEQLGALTPEQRDRTVGWLRAAAARGPALSKDERDRLAYEVLACELRLSRPAGRSA